jgi:hypothetical protein
MMDVQFATVRLTMALRSTTQSMATAMANR